MTDRAQRAEAPEPGADDSMGRLVADLVGEYVQAAVDAVGVKAGAFAERYTRLTGQPLPKLDPALPGGAAAAEHGDEGDDGDEDGDPEGSGFLDGDEDG